MSGLATLRELFDHNDWARDKVLKLADGLSDEQLDRTFEMGSGSLRATLFHLWACEFGWLRRWQPGSDHGYADEPAGESVEEIRRRFVETAAERDALIDGLTDADAGRRITFERSSGGSCTFPLGDMMLHVTNHGIHHRAQALNMLRHLGIEKVPGVDYLFMRAERPTVQPSPEMIEQSRQRGFNLSPNPGSPVEFDLDTLREYYRFSDWATNYLHGLAVELSDEQLDREFEMGLITLRKTLMHLNEAEVWWHSYWIKNPKPRNDKSEAITMAELGDRIRESNHQRDTFLATCSPDDLLQPVTIEPSPGRKMTFRLGESVMQLPGHGTHHRAQAINMLRRMGVALKDVDYLDWYRETN